MNEEYKFNYQIFQVQCCSCLDIYDVRTFVSGHETDLFPCHVVEFEELYSHGFCPPCLEDKLNEIDEKHDFKTRLNLGINGNYLI